MTRTRTAAAAISVAALGIAVSCDEGGGGANVVVDRLWLWVRDVALDDLDGDGRCDIVVARENGGISWISVANGSGDLKFTAQLLPFAWDAGAIGDIDGDGRKDIVAAARGRISILLQDAPGSFTEAEAFQLPAFLFPLFVGDLNGDGRLDLVVGSPGTVSASVLVVYQGLAPATFLPPVVLDSAGLPLEVADLDGDGRCDILCRGARGEAFAVYRQDPDAPGTFDRTAVPATAPGGGDPAWSLAAADLDDDGRLDVAYTGENSRKLFVRFREAGETLAFGPAIPLDVRLDVRSVVSGDLNGDGAADLVAGASRDHAVLIVLADPRRPGEFRRVRGVKNRKASVPAGIADVTGDGRADIVCRGDLQVTVLQQVGSSARTFRKWHLYP